MFDGLFYQLVLPETVKQQCEQQAGHVPVVQLHLANGTTLDVCHIVSLGPTWLTVAYFRDPAESDEVEQALLPYTLVQWISLSFHPPHVRRIGFDVEQSAAATEIKPITPLQTASTAASQPPTSIPTSASASTGREATTAR
jgi:hypothetical protein